LSNDNATVSLSKKAENLIPYFIMAVFVFIIQAGALWLSATEYIISQPPLENPESVGYSIYYIVVLLIFTAIMVFLIKKNKTLLIRGVIYFAIFTTLLYVFIAILDKAIGYTYLTLAVSFIGAFAFAVLLYIYPEWYVIDAAGLLISIGACAVIGVSLSYMPIIVLMIALIIYDFISVYKTKHMMTLASGMMKLKLPILFVIPKRWNYSYIEEDFSDDVGGKATTAEKAAAEEETTGVDTKTEMGEATTGVDAKAEMGEATAGVDAKAEMGEATASESVTDAVQSEEGTEVANDEVKIRKKKSDALFMGLGDAVIPTLLVISANHFLAHDGPVSVLALFTMAGTFLGFAALMYVVSKGKPQAGLPFLNTGAIFGFLAGVLISGTAISFSLGF